MKGLNPNMDQGIDITLLPGSCPMDSVYENQDFDNEEDIKVLNGVIHITEHYVVPAWRQADGIIIPIKDMETSHIKNCIHMIHRKNGTWRHQYLRYFENELRRRRHKRLNCQIPE